MRHVDADLLMRLTAHVAQFDRSQRSRRDGRLRRRADGEGRRQHWVCAGQVDMLQSVCWLFRQFPQG